ncbi:MAG TPA: Hsp70 family protein [Myxococcales bacterium]|nr:Hsp70 family protein [Myxococcales bacterium]
MDARYSVGIDLGTTNSALAEVDLAEPERPGEPLPAPVPLPIPQMVARGETAPRELLPSFVYLPPAHEGLGGFVVGAYARERGAQVPGRLVASSKSWLSHPGVDRRSQLLPPGAEADVGRISPVEAAARILGHVRKSWDAAHAGDKLSLADQAVTLTVPASFDAVARELTVQAAKEAGLEHLTLLEEPQAALYAWVQAAGEGWRKHVQPGEVILVVDVGGGTTDFSLIAVAEDEGRLALTRLSVGDHILLGGDNVDLALAHAVNEKLKAKGTRLDSWQFAALTYACRNAKETGTTALVIPGRGSGLVGGTLRAELTEEERRRTVDSFFPEVDVTAAPAVQRRAGLTTIGLPYAQDPAVTRHLAAFLRRSAGAVGPKKGATFPHPTAILFNGGVFKDASLQERIAALVERWVRAEGGPALKRLRSSSLDLAVAAGAAYSGLARRGRGIRIRGGTARAYYVGVEAAVPAVPGFAAPVRAICLAPFGMEEGGTVDLPGLEVGAVVGETASFRFFASSSRRDDAPGTVVEDVESLEELPAIETTLPSEGGGAGDVLPVHLRAHVTEVGTLELRLVSAEGRTFQLEFSVRHE